MVTRLSGFIEHNTYIFLTIYSLEPYIFNAEYVGHIIARVRPFVIWIKMHKSCFQYNHLNQSSKKTTQ